MRDLSLGLQYKMETCYEKLFTQRPHLSVRTRNIYKTNIEKCMKCTECTCLEDLCCKTDCLLEYIESATPNTGKLAATALIALMKENSCTEEQYMPIVKKYQELVLKLRESAEEQSVKGDFASLDEIKHVEKLLTKRVKGLRLFQHDVTRHEDLELLMNLLVVRLHLLVPFRNELSTLRVTSKNKDTLVGNWYLTRPHKIILNDYKTARRYGRREYSIPAHISRLATRVMQYARCDALLYLPRHPERPIGSTYFNYFLNRIFEQSIGKRIGSSAIRKAHVTELYKSAPTIKQKKELAEMMNHAPQTAELYYYKPNESA